MISFLLDKSQIPGWPRGQDQVPHLRSRIELGGQVAYQSIWELSASTIWWFSRVSISMWSEVIEERRRWPKRAPVTSSVTSHNQKCKNKAGKHVCNTWQQYLMCLNSEFGSYHLCCKMSNFRLSRLIMGEATRLNWPQMACMEKPIYKMYVPVGLLLFWKFHLLGKDCLPLAALRSPGILWPCGGLLMMS